MHIVLANLLRGGARVGCEGFLGIGEHRAADEFRMAHRHDRLQSEK